MAKSREQKKEILSRLEDALSSSASSVFVHFNGLGVGDEGEMRRTLRERGLSYFVAKKTLIKRAFDTAKPIGDAPELVGEIAVVYGSEDASVPSREVYSFVKKFKDKLAIVGGIFEGAFKNNAEMNEIAAIPSQHVLRGMLVNVINSPIQGFVSVLHQVAEKRS